MPGRRGKGKNVSEAAEKKALTKSPDVHFGSIFLFVWKRNSGRKKRRNPSLGLKRREEALLTIALSRLAKGPLRTRRGEESGFRFLSPFSSAGAGSLGGENFQEASLGKPGDEGGGGGGGSMFYRGGGGLSFAKKEVTSRSCLSGKKKAKRIFSRERDTTPPRRREKRGSFLSFLSTSEAQRIL